MKAKKIVLTGGPCAGKSTLIRQLEQSLIAGGLKVYTVSETATLLMSEGKDPQSLGSREAFQHLRIRTQNDREKVIEAFAEACGDEAVILCDRGLLDSLAYMSEEAFEKALLPVGLTKKGAEASYDAVFCLETAAKGAPESYTLENNSHRKESPEEAALLDDRIICAWRDAPYVRYIPATQDIEEKARLLILAAWEFLSSAERP